MNVLLFSRILSKTGVGNYVKSLAEELVRQGHSVIVVSSSKDIDLDKEITFISLPATSNNPLQILKTIKKLHSIIKSRGIEVVHCHHRKAALIMQIYNKFYHIPFVYTLHSSSIPSNFLHRKLTFIGDRAIAISSDVRTLLINKFNIPHDKITTIQNGVRIIPPLTSEQIEHQKATWGIPRDKYVLTLHSRIDATKNHLLMVEAIAKLSEEAREKVVVVCSGEKSGEYYRRVVTRISELGLNNKFIFVGWCNTAEVLGISDFLFLPSIKEGFALSIAEAFFLKIPVARTRTGGFDEQKFCLPIDAYDPQPTIDIIESLVSNGKEYYAEQAEASYKLAMNEFTIDVMTKQNVKVYEEVCAK